MNFDWAGYKHYLWIVGIWAGSQITCFLFFGIRWGGDSGRYVEAARNILNGIPLVGEQWYYLAYEWMLVPIFFLGGGFRAVVFFQGLMSLIGAFFLFEAGKKMFSPNAGMAAAIAYLIHPSIQRWNYYILTESLATSTLISVFALAVLGRETWWGKTALITTALVLALTRPETPLFLLPISIYFLEFRWSSSTFIGIVLMGVLGAVWWNRPGSPGSFGLLRQWEQGTYIWGYPGIGEPSLRFEPGSPGSMGTRILQLIWADPLWGIKVVGLKVYYFLLPVRPYFSRLHNWVALGSSIGIYALAVGGTIILKSREGKLIGGIFLVQAGLVALTWSDWDSRWLDRVMPLLILLSAGGGAAFWKSFGFKRHKTVL